MFSWLLSLLTLLGFVGLTTAVFGLRGAHGPRGIPHYRRLFGFSVVLLAATAFFGWPGPFGAPGIPLGGGPDVPRADLRRVNPAQLALNAVGPSNRGADPRVLYPDDPARAGSDRLLLIMRADDAADRAGLQAQIRRDSWRILQALYRDRRLDRVQEIMIHATHPSGEAAQEAGGEPVVAEIRLTRGRFDRVVGRGDLDPAELERIADVRWLPPLR